MQLYGRLNSATGRALYSNTASYNGALSDNTTGNYNAASGTAALYDNTTGHYNTASGLNALYRNTT